jgi:hypothetical protein
MAAGGNQSTVWATTPWGSADNFSFRALKGQDPIGHQEQSMQKAVQY